MLHQFRIEQYIYLEYSQVQLINGPEIISKFLGESERNLRLVCGFWEVVFGNASISVYNYCVCSHSSEPTLKQLKRPTGNLVIPATSMSSLLMRLMPSANLEVGERCGVFVQIYREMTFVHLHLFPIR